MNSNIYCYLTLKTFLHARLFQYSLPDIVFLECDRPMISKKYKWIVLISTLCIFSIKILVQVFPMVCDHVGWLQFEFVLSFFHQESTLASSMYLCLYLTYHKQLCIYQLGHLCTYNRSRLVVLKIVWIHEWFSATYLNLGFTISIFVSSLMSWVRTTYH